MVLALKFRILRCLRSFTRLTLQGVCMYLTMNEYIGKEKKKTTFFSSVSFNYSWLNSDLLKSGFHDSCRIFHTFHLQHFHFFLMWPMCSRCCVILVTLSEEGSKGTEGMLHNLNPATSSQTHLVQVCLLIYHAQSFWFLNPVVNTETNLSEHLEIKTKIYLINTDIWFSITKVIPITWLWKEIV